MAEQHEVEISWSQTLKVWWAYQWRWYLAVGSASFLITLVATLSGISRDRVPTPQEEIVFGCVLLVGSVLLSLYLLKVALRRCIKDLAISFKVDDEREAGGV